MFANPSQSGARRPRPCPSSVEYQRKLFLPPAEPLPESTPAGNEVLRRQLRGNRRPRHSATPCPLPDRRNARWACSNGCDDNNRAGGGEKFARIAAHLRVAGHPGHLAVIAAAEPRQQSIMLAIEPFGRNDANLLKAFTQGSLFDEAGQLMQVKHSSSQD